ncbi:hypothetical protein BOTBODRAFT_34685 [Botryobasidium botryosum FD-172 SS1]|uniref:SRR1-like domain-containing protein n=1 Tax=Botryobasidium botryosum (strain FD-172 SS1) TaxID=930990 RepID=A0A067MA17_BOTB1|nr:hypothetical protein BOTBODRAFT_34685 [Botryobasidium botryosum FD-172 SS1]
MADTGFTYVSASSRSKKKRKNKPHLAAEVPLSIAIERTRADLCSHTWWNDWSQFINMIVPDLPCRPTHALCLGLGSPSSSPTSRAQLCLLLDLLVRCEIPRGNTSIYDPVFAEEDKETLSSLGLSVSLENKRAKHPCTDPTLVFMPHCPLRLYENILRENWSARTLSGLILVANTFSGYVESIPKRKLQTQAPCLERLASLVISHPVPSFRDDPSAFNNTSIQFAPPASLPSHDDQFWVLPQEPELGEGDGEVV